MGKVKEVVSTLEQNLASKALRVIESANSFSPLDRYPLLKTTKRIVWDLVVNKPFTIVVDSRERLNTLRAAGLSDETITRLIIAHAVADMTVPLAVMWLINPLLNEIQNLSLFGELGATYILGRAGYGAVAGLTRELAYAILPKPNSG